MTDAPALTEASLGDDGAPRGVVSLPDGGRLAYEERGARHGGVPVLLLRPLAGSMALWGAFRDDLARRFRVVAFDPRGVGASSDAPVDVGTRDMARDALAVLDALRIDRAHVFGLSLGAMVATWLAADAPSRVSRLCLASAGAVGLSLRPVGVAEMAVEMLDPGDDVVRRLADALISPEVRAEEPGRVAAVDVAAEAEPDRRVELWKRVLAAARHDARGALRRITAPTLVLAGARDALLAADAPAALAAGIDGARLAVLDDAGHDVTLERPDEAARHAAEFFAGA